MYMMKTFNGDCSMKKLIYTLGIIAAAAFTFSSCQKEQSIEQPSGKLVTVSFTAEKAGLDTRTAAVEGEQEVSFIWTDEDVANIKLFTVSTTINDKGQEVEELTVVANPRVSKVSDTKLTIAADVAPNATYNFRAVLAGTWTNDGKKPRVGENQVPSSTNYDPAADVLVSDDMEVTVGAANDGEETVVTDALEMVFRRQVVVNKMTLKNLTDGEAIKKIVITSNKDIVGYFNARTPSGDKKTITLNYNDVIVPEGNVFPVYFTTIPGKGHSLTIEVTTDQYVYTKSFAEGKSVDFNLGQFTKFNFALPAGVANTALTLPVEDAMTWAMTGGSDETAAMTIADLTPKQGEKKIYDSSSNAYKGGDGLKLGKGGEVGSITTNAINLSSSFYVAIDAKRFGTDKVKLSIAVDGTVVYTTPENLTADYETYYFNSTAATATSKITISTVANTDKRGYINNLVIGSGTYVAPPVINVTSANPIDVPNTASNQTIEYTIANPTTGSALSATTEDEWITNIDYSISGKVTFSVAAQEAGAPAREGIITLSYAGAKDVVVTVRQAAGEGGATTYAYLFTNKSWNATLNGESANWTSGQDGSGYSNNGIQVTTSASGANGTSPCAFTDIEEIVVTYCTNASNGVGAIKVTVGDGTTKTFNVTKPSSGGTTPKTNTFTYSPKESGSVTIEVTCTTNSLYLIGASIKAAGLDNGGGGDTPSSKDPIVIDKDTPDFPTAYGLANQFTEYTLNGLKYKIQQVYVTGGKLQWRAAGNSSGTGIIYNSQEMPSGITSIVIEYNSSDANKNHTVQIGSSENPTTATSITPTKDGSKYTFAGDGASKYFVITNGTGAGYIDSITINFE